jgi:hypothetical protein
VAALRRYADNAAWREETAADNLKYLDEHENGPQQAIDLLARVRALCARPR